MLLNDYSINRIFFFFFSFLLINCSKLIIWFGTFHELTLAPFQFVFIQIQHHANANAKGYQSKEIPNRCRPHLSNQITYSNLHNWLFSQQHTLLPPRISSNHLPFVCILCQPMPYMPSQETWPLKLPYERYHLCLFHAFPRTSFPIYERYNQDLYRDNKYTGFDRTFKSAAYIYFAWLLSALKMLKDKTRCTGIDSGPSMGALMR